MSPEDVQDLSRSARQPRADPTIVVCSDALFAIGCYCASKAENPRASATSKPLLDSFRRLTAVLTSYKYLWEAPTSLVKLQVCTYTNGIRPRSVTFIAMLSQWGLICSSGNTAHGKLASPSLSLCKAQWAQDLFAHADTKHASIASICDLARMGPLLASAASCLRELRLVGPQSSMLWGQTTRGKSLSAEKCVQAFFCLDAWYSFQQGVSTVGPCPAPRFKRLCNFPLFST